MLQNLTPEPIHPAHALPDSTSRDYDLVRRAIRFLSEHWTDHQISMNWRATSDCRPRTVRNYLSAGVG